MESKHAKLVGELDVAHAAALADELRALAARNRDLSVDLAEVTRVDAAGAQLLLALRRALVASGGTLALVNVPQDVACILERTGLGALLSKVEEVTCAEDGPRGG